MGRSVPSYNKIFNEELIRIRRLKRILPSVYHRYIDWVTDFLSRRRASLSKDPDLDISIDLIYMVMIEILRRIDEFGGLDNKDIPRLFEE